MNETKKAAQAYIDAQADFFEDISDQIWEYAELSLKENRSAALYISKLKELGFDVTENLGGISTSFCGSYGSGHPVIGILGEYVSAIYTKVNNRPLVIEKKRVNF